MLTAATKAVGAGAQIFCYYDENCTSAGSTRNTATVEVCALLELGLS